MALIKYGFDQVSLSSSITLIKHHFACIAWIKHHFNQVLLQSSITSIKYHFDQVSL